MYDLQGVMLYLKYFYKASLWGWHWVTFKSGDNFLEQVNYISSWFQIQEKVQWKELDIYRFYFFMTDSKVENLESVKTQKQTLAVIVKICWDFFFF